MVSCNEIVAYLDTVLSKPSYPKEIPAIWQDSPHSIQRIGLVLEPGPGIQEWVQMEKIDALFLHRPWKIAEHPIAEYIPVFTYHLPFDEHLTIGYNIQLARLTQLQEIKSLGRKEGRPLGMMGRIPPVKDTAFVHYLNGLFNGLEESFQLQDKIIHTIAFAGAMSEQLLREATDSDVQLYITGQFRNVARNTAVATQMGIVAVGHYRSEIFGLQLLANLLTDQWPLLTICINTQYPSNQHTSLNG